MKRRKQKNQKSKKKKKEKKFKVNPFASSNSNAPASPLHAKPNDRFASGSNEMELNRSTGSDHCLPKLPHRGDNGLGLPPRRGESPTPMRHSIAYQNDSEPESPQSPPSRRQHRRSSLDHFTSAVGALAKQPVKLAKQPVRLAKYTSKKVRKGVGRVRRSRDSSDDELDFGLGTPRGFPSCPPVYRPQSSDDEDIPGLAAATDFDDDSFRENPLPAHSSRQSGDDSNHESSRNGYGYDREINPGASSPPDSKRGRRSSLSHVTNAIGVLAMQPVRLAKQPVRLAKYTTKKVRKRVVRSRNSKSSEDDDEDSLDGIDPSLSTLAPALPRAPPVYKYGLPDSSDDDDQDFNFKVASSSLPPPRQTSEMESGDDDIDNSDVEGFQTSTRTVSRGDRPRRRSSLQHVTNAIGTVAKQPYKLAKYTAKQPIKLAKYTGKNIRKRIKMKKQDDSSIVSDPEELMISEDDTPLDLHDSSSIKSLEESPLPNDTRRASHYPQGMLSPIIDVSEHNSSADLSTTLNGFMPPATVGNVIIKISDVIMMDDSDLEDASEDEDIIDVELAEASEDEDIFELEFVGVKGEGEDESRADIDCKSQEEMPRPTTPPRRIEMTGEVVCSGNVPFSPDDTLLDDLIAGVDQEDMDYLKAIHSPALLSPRIYQTDQSEGSSGGSLQSLKLEQMNVVPVNTRVGANPQDTNEIYITQTIA